MLGSSIVTDEPTAERPLTLDELLAATPGDLPIQVEVKAHADPELARHTAQILCERYRGAAERRRLELISFHSAACATAAAYGLRSRLVVWAEYAPEALAAWAVSRGVTGVSVEHFLLAPKLVAVFRLAGLSVSTGTVNDPESLARVTELALPDAVCSDRPAELRAEALRLEEARQPQHSSTRNPRRRRLAPVQLAEHRRGRGSIWPRSRGPGASAAASRRQ